jgi:hypothetical protein
MPACAALDDRIWSPSVPNALAGLTDAVVDVTHDTAPRDGVARPGWITVQLREDSAGGGDATHEIRSPIYPESGHMVSAWQPAEILEDVRSWYQAGR